jgi:hypothetical protein
MNTCKRVLGVLLISTAILTICLLGTGCNSGARSDSNQHPVTPEISDEIRKLRKKHGQIHFGISPNNYQERHWRMHGLLSEWTPIGTTSNELMYLLGHPTEPSSRRNPNPVLGYRIDTGMAGTVWFFELENQKVIRVEAKGID